MPRRRVWLTNRSLVTPIAEHARVPTPGFVEYIWKFALPIVLLAFALVSSLFFPGSGSVAQAGVNAFLTPFCRSFN